MSIVQEKIQQLQDLFGAEISDELALFGLQLGVQAGKKQIIVVNEFSDKEIQRGYCFPISFFKGKKRISPPVGAHPLFGMSSSKDVVEALYELKAAGIFSLDGKRYTFFNESFLKGLDASDPELFPAFTWDQWFEFASVNYPRPFKTFMDDGRADAYLQQFLITQGEGFEFNGVSKGVDGKGNRPLPMLLSAVLDLNGTEVIIEARKPEYPNGFHDFMGFKSGNQWERLLVLLGLKLGLFRIDPKDLDDGRKRRFTYWCAVQPPEEGLLKLKEEWGLTEEVEVDTPELEVEETLTQPEITPNLLELLTEVLASLLPDSENRLPTIETGESGLMHLTDYNDLSIAELQSAQAALTENADAIDGLSDLLRGFQLNLRSLATAAGLRMELLQQDSELEEFANNLTPDQIRRMQEILDNKTK